MALAAWQATIVDESGNIQSEASVEVLLESSGALAALFSDRDGLTPIDNPVTAGSDGFVRFYSAGNSFRINATLGSFSRTWRHVALGILGEKDSLPGSLINYDRTVAEIAASVTPTNFYYPPGDTRRYGAIGDGATDDTDAINDCADVCREGGYTLLLPAITSLVSESLDFSQITVRGTDDSGFSNPHIVASSDQFNVIISYGNSTFENFFVDGSWDGSTAGQTGDVFHFDATGQNPSNVAYNIHLRNVRIRDAKRRSVYWYKGGYGSIRSCAMNNSGLHVVELEGTSAVQCTTIVIDGKSTLSDAPNGFGLKLTEFVSILCNGVIMENTQGIQLNAANNRSLTLIDVYQEGTEGGVFLTNNSSGGIGFTMFGCYGAVIGMDDLTSWEDVHIYGNSAITTPAVPFAGRIQESTGSEVTTSTTGGTNFTAVSFLLGIGTWKVWGELQVADGGSLSASFVLACRLTTTEADSGDASATNNNFEVGADKMGDAKTSDRVKAFKIFRLTSAATVYLRGYANFAAGTLAYKGHLYAELVQ